MEALREKWSEVSLIFLFSGVQFSNADLFSLLCLWLQNRLKKKKKKKSFSKRIFLSSLDFVSICVKK